MMASPGMASAPAISVEALGPVQPVAGEDLLPSAVEMDLDAVAVVLDFMKPLLALRRLGLQRGELGLNEPRHGSIRFGTNATHKKPAAPWGQRRAFYLLPENPEQSGDVIASATTDATKGGARPRGQEGGPPETAAFDLLAWSRARHAAVPVPSRSLKDKRGRTGRTSHQRHVVGDVIPSGFDLHSNQRTALIASLQTELSFPPSNRIAPFEQSLGLKLRHKVPLPAGLCPSPRRGEQAPPPSSGKAGALALQLPFCFEVRALSDGLVSSAPE